MSKTADVLDAMLEASVVGSFTRLGSAMRRRADHWDEPAPGALKGRVIAITGATSGLGLATARRVGALGAHVIVLARDPEKAERTIVGLHAETGGTFEPVIAEMGDLASVRRAGEILLARHPKLDALVHNAGALDDVRAVSPQGIEQTVASHVVGPFLLTQLVRSALARAAPSRVIWVSSGGMYAEPLSVDALELSEAEYDGVVAYARAKRAQVTLTEMMAERFAADGIVVHAMHPGWADTPGVARSLPTFRRVVGPLLRTPDDGADTLVWLLASDDVLRASGSFWLDRRPRPLHKLARTRRSDTPEERERLWRWVIAKSEAPIERR